MAKESIAVLHLASLEETRTEEEKPNPLRNRTRDGLRLESDKNGRLGSSSKSYFTNYNNHQTIKNEGLC
mgnify:CR=1|jgi:hypothetical protein